MDPQTLVALAGIGATLIGTLGGALGNQHLGARLARAAEDRRDRKAARTAARLIDADLQWVAAIAQVCVRNGNWWPWDQRFTVSAWEQHRSAIASMLTLMDWTRVTTAVEIVGQLQAARDRASNIARATMAIDPETRDLDVDVADTSPPFPAGMARKIEAMLTDIRAGRKALRQLAGDE